MFNILRRKKKVETLSEREHIEQEEKRMEAIFLGTEHGQHWQKKINEFGEEGEQVYKNHLITFKLAFLLGGMEEMGKVLKNTAFKKIDGALIIVMLVANIFNTVTISDQAEIIENLNREIKTLKQEEK